MLDAVAAAAIEVAGAAGLTLGLADFLGDFGQIDALDDLAGAGREFGVLGHRIAGESRWLLVLAGLIMADQTVDIAFELMSNCGPSVL